MVLGDIVQGDIVLGDIDWGGGIDRGDIVREDIVLGDIDWGVLTGRFGLLGVNASATARAGRILSWGILSWGDIVLGGYCSEG